MYGVGAHSPEPLVILPKNYDETNTVSLYVAKNLEGFELWMSELTDHNFKGYNLPLLHT